jgi:hypothetical protein
MSLEALAAFAVNNNHAVNKKVPLHELPVIEARKLVKIKDGNRKPAPDGSQALTLVLGRRTISLDTISKGATRVNATVNLIDTFTNVLQIAVDNGDFDKAIAEVQEAAAPAPLLNPVSEGVIQNNTQGTLSLNKSIPQSETVVSSDAIEGLDFGDLE